MGVMVTGKGSYQVALLFFLVLFPLLCTADLLAVRTSLKHDYALPALFVGLALQPISVLGLWSDKAWGVLLLVFATALCLFTVIGAAIGALIVLALTSVRFLLSSRRSDK
jgi:hypothetical protein